MDAVALHGNDAVVGSLFSYGDLEKRVRPDHPLRVIRGLMNSALADLSSAFDALYSPFGRESIPPERLIRALLFRRFVGLCLEDPVWDAATFSKNRDHLFAGDVAVKSLAALLAQPKVKVLLSSEYFSFDDTLLEASASTKRFRPKGGSGPPPGTGRNGEQNFHGQKRSNETHASTTDPMQGFIAKDAARKPNWPSWGMG
ncbi:MAG: transposase [Roseomonas sp.]|nr:transposase [Roseomonas sp.]